MLGKSFSIKKNYLQTLLLLLLLLHQTNAHFSDKKIDLRKKTSLGVNPIKETNDNFNQYFL
jgi:hypothetical protein